VSTKERIQGLNRLFASVGLLERLDEVNMLSFLRRPYNMTSKFVQGGGQLFWNDKLSYSSVEWQGQGCQRLYKADEFERILAMFPEGVTRFDIAVDIKTDIAPTDWIDAGVSQRVKSVGYQKSETGETVYLGSPKSDVFCRVYRYESPHPRSAFLRIEFVTRKERAQQCARIWLEQGPVLALQQAAAGFQFTHPLWEFENVKTEPLPTHTRQESKTMRWLIKQVKPAILRLLESGQVSGSFWDEFFDGIPSCKYSSAEQEGQDEQRGDMEQRDKNGH